MRDKYLHGTKDEYTYLGRAVAGCYANSRNPHGPPCDVSIYDMHLARYFGDMAEGAWVLDRKYVPYPDLVEWVYRGAMLRVDYPPGTCGKCFDSETPIPCDDMKSLRSLDYVSLDLYIKHWVTLGAIAGYRKGRKIIWVHNREGETLILPAARRLEMKDPDGGLLTLTPG